MKISPLAGMWITSKYPFTIFSYGTILSIDRRRRIWVDFLRYLGLWRIVGWIDWRMIASSKWSCSLRNNQVKIQHDRSVSTSAFSGRVAVTYEVEVHTGEEQEKPLDSPAYIQIFGVTTNTPKLFLESKNAAFTKDSKSKFSIPSNNVGAVRFSYADYSASVCVFVRFNVSLLVTKVLGKWMIGIWKQSKSRASIKTRKKSASDTNYLNKFLIDVLDLDTPSISGWAQWKASNNYSLNSLVSHLRLDLHVVTHRSFLEALRPTCGYRLATPTYSILVQTADVPQTQTTENVEMIVRGSAGQIMKFPLREHAKTSKDALFQRGNLDEFEVEHPNIGNVTSLPRLLQPCPLSLSLP